MAVKRRARGTVGETIQAAWRIRPETKDTVTRIAEASGITSTYLIELMVANLPLTDQGIPTWLPERDRSGELPIEAA